MKTYFLGVEEVRQYLRDFLVRLESMESPAKVWCSVTPSGRVLVKAIVELLQSDRRPVPDGVRLLHIDVMNSGAGQDITFSEDPGDALKGQHVLLLDGAIHSGATMSACVDEVLKFGASDVTSYGLVLRCGTSFVPTFWGVMTDDTDRSYFLLEAIPNHRLDAGASTRKGAQSPVQIRRLDERHVKSAPIVSGVSSIDRVTWSDRLFQMHATHHSVRTFVLERRDVILGFLTVNDIGADELSIDEIATAQAEAGRGHGGTLMRFADTIARQKDCRIVRLNAIRSRVDWYRQRGYEVTPGSKPIRLDQEEYQPMERRILYHVDAHREAGR